MLDIQRLKGLLGKEIITSKLMSDLLGVSTFIILTASGAFIRIQLPFTPVPITLQTFFVLLGGTILGSSRGSLSQSLYVLLGGLGLPIFAGASGGLSHLAGPTGGYLFGFILAAYLVGRVGEKKKNSFVYTILAMSLGMGIIYLLGSLWLAGILRIGIKKTLFLGVIPFLPGDILKLISAALIYKVISKMSDVRS